MKFLKGERSQIYSLLIVLNGIEMKEDLRKDSLLYRTFNRTKWN